MKPMDGRLGQLGHTDCGWGSRRAGQGLQRQDQLVSPHESSKKRLYPSTLKSPSRKFTQRRKKAVHTKEVTLRLFIKRQTLEDLSGQQKLQRDGAGLARWSGSL